jgi:DNA-binding ferritin-like protein (Dps family)
MSELVCLLDAIEFLEWARERGKKLREIVGDN